MAAAGQELQKLTECCICFKEFTDPRMLPCIHTFCLDCLKQTGETANKGPGENMPCPLCRKEFSIPAEGINGLQKNFFMQHLIDVKTTLSLNTTSFIPCDICKAMYEGQKKARKRATMRCSECGDNFCYFCSRAHKLQKLSKDHHIVKIGSETEDDIRKMFPTKNCNDHKQKPLDYYCPECRRLVCVSCLLENHVSHRCKDVTSVEEEFRKTIEKNALTIASYAEELLSKERNTNKRKTEFLDELEKIENEIHSRYQELRELIDQHTTSLFDEISQMKQTQLKKFQMEEEEIEHFHTISKSFEAYSTELCSKGSACDICGCFDELLRRATELIKDHDEYLSRPSESIKVSFKAKDLEAMPDMADRNIVGKIQRITSRFKNCVTVVGLCDGGKIATTEALAINLYRSSEILNLHQLPTKMSNEASAAVFANTMYVTGIGAYNNEIWKYYNFSGWMKCASLCIGRRRHSAAFIDEVLYICGGFVGSSKRVLDSVESFNAATNKCTTVGKLIHGVENSGNCVPFRSSLYIFGGLDKDGNNVSHVQMYNTEQNSCTLLSTQMPHPYRLMRAALWETSVILVGQNTCFIFNFETETWEERKQFKTDVTYFGLVLENERVFVIGGGMYEKDKDGNATWKCRDDIRYAPLQNILQDKPIEWKFHATLPRPSLIDVYAKLTYHVD